MTLIPSMLLALFLTLILELLFALLWGIRNDGLLMVFLMNLLTNPAVNLLHEMAGILLGWQGFWLVLVLEAAAILAEGLCCRGLVRHPWLFAILVNLFSYGIGELLQVLF